MFRRGSNATGCATTFFLIAVFLAVGIGLSLWGWSVLQNARVSESWPTASGEVLSSTVRVDRDEDGTSYFADVTYRYVVDDLEYASDSVSFGQFGSSDRDHAEGIVARYPVGSQVTVFYDPEDVETAVLEPGVTWSSYMLLGMGILFIGIPLIMLPFMLRQRFT